MSVESIESAISELSPVVDHAASSVSVIIAKLDEMEAKDAKLEVLASQLRNLKDVLVSTFGAPEVAPESATIPGLVNASS
jgi:hypothetical protein